MRISGFGMETEGFVYVRRGQDGWDIDIEAIRKAIEDYALKAEGEDKYSISGLCIALEITRETLELWRAGYACREDEENRRIVPNAELAECVARGELYIHRYWEESEKATSLHTKQLENAGVLGKKPSGARPPFDLGSLRKYSK